jgi:hypothetical protein
MKTKQKKLIDVNRFNVEHQAVSSRILVISVTSDSYLQYVPIMNCIFAAQKKVKKKPPKNKNNQNYTTWRKIKREKEVRMKLIKK